MEEAGGDALRLFRCQLYAELAQIQGPEGIDFSFVGKG